MDILPGGTATFLLLFGLFLGAFAVRSALRLYRVLRLVRSGARMLPCAISCSKTPTPSRASGTSS